MNKRETMQFDVSEITPSFPATRSSAVA